MTVEQTRRKDLCTNENTHSACVLNVSWKYIHASLLDSQIPFESAHEKSTRKEGNDLPKTQESDTGNSPDKTRSTSFLHRFLFCYFNERAMHPVFTHNFDVYSFVADVPIVGDAPENATVVSHNNCTANSSHQN